jgi:hypothetical protein
MSIEIQCVPYDRLLEQLITRAEGNLSICSPFVTADGAELALRGNVRIRLITKATAANLSTKALDGKSLRRMLEAGAEIRSIANLHAKLYMIDGMHGIVTSSNLTGPGLYKNLELGLIFQNEEVLYQALNSVFEELWQRAVSVTLEGLDNLEVATKKATLERGVWIKNVTDIQNEPLIPAPAIGFIETTEYAIPLANQVPHLSINATDNYRNSPDESGDIFGTLPRSSSEILELLQSDDRQLVQPTLNTISLLAPKHFHHWLDSLSADDINELASPANTYPYKSLLLSRILQDGGPCHVAVVIQALCSKASNESQLLKYLPRINETFASAPQDWLSIIAPLICDIVNELAKAMDDSDAKNKNFAKPNLDRLMALLESNTTTAGFAINAKELVKHRKIPVSLQESEVPGFQIIKRQRETLGFEFRDWAFANFHSIKFGEWDDYLPSLLSLFKELRKVQLSSDDVLIVMEVAVNVCARLDLQATEFRDHVISASAKWENNANASWFQNNKQEFTAARKDLNPVGKQAVKATGRWVNLYGRMIKELSIERDTRFKEAIDWLSSYLLVRKELIKWMGSHGSRVGIS